jgi:DNA-binding response OmpR family regulator
MALLPRILVVDGDASMRETLREQLTRDDAFAVIEAEGAMEAERRLFAEDTSFDAVIMDAALPDGDGHLVRDRLRAHGVSIPVILMNGLDHPCPNDDTITITKPFRLSELMARLRSRLAARSEAEADTVSIQIGPYEFRPEDKVLCRDAASTRIRLTEKEAAILAFLHRMKERAVPRQELLTEVWGYNPDVTTHTLETHIYRLRQKIEADPADACLLVTEAGGYRLAVG